MLRCNINLAAGVVAFARARPSAMMGWALAKQGFEVPREFRDFADKGVDQARNVFGNLLNGAIKTSEQLQSTTTTVQSTLHAAVLKGLDHAQSNANAAFDYAQRLAHSKDLREAFEIQVEFVRRQVSALQAQAKDFGSLVDKAKH